MAAPGSLDDDPAVVVVGSLNLDVVVRAPHHPRPGETVLGHDHYENPGGKGANQAVAAARLGADVAMVGRVGADPAAEQLRASLADAGVDVGGVATDPEARTGAAFITVSDEGENTIVVSPGANARLAVTDVERHRSLLQSCQACLVQLEVSDEVVGAAARTAGGRVILNPAPARALPEGLLADVDVLVPNEGELAVLSGGTATPDHPDEIAALARSVPVEQVVVTLGARGALVVDGERVTQVTAPLVDVVDTTAAGDTFCGALAAALVGGRDLVAATEWAVLAGTCTVQHHGAQQAMPDRHDVEALRDAHA